MRSRPVIRLLAAAALVAVLPTARAADAPPAATDDAKAKALAAAFDGAVKSKEWEARRDAATALAGADHPTLSDRLLSLARDDADTRVRAAALAALGGQARSKAKVGAALLSRLEALARARAAQRRAAVAPVPLDEKNEPRKDEKTRRVLETRRAEGAEAAAAMRSLRR